MAGVLTSCPTCGDIELDVTELRVLICSSTSEGSYVFRCPSCDVLVLKRAEPNIVDVLVASGVDASVWHMPAELWEDHHGPPIIYDDLLDFHFQLESDDWVQELYSL